MDEEQESQGISAADILAIAKRRFWWIAVPVLLGPVIGVGLTYALKHVYTSQAFVLIDQPKVGEKYVSEVVTDQTEARLSTMQDQILSRSQLEPIIQKYGLDRGGSPGKAPDVESLRKRIRVKPIVPDGSNVVSGFYVAADADRPDVAKGICTEVLSMFINQNLHVHQQQAEDTTQFLTEQLAEAKKKLDQDDAALASFKEHYMGQLPSDEARNMQMMASTGTQLDVVTQELAQAEQQRLFQESMIAQQMATQSKMVRQPDGQLSPAAPAAAADDLDLQLERLQAQERDMRARYTPDHPDVVKIHSEIVDLEARIKERRKLAAAKIAATPVASAPAAGSAQPAGTPELDRMRLTLHMTEAAIREKQAERERLQRELATYQGRIQLSPAVEEKYKLLTRDYETSLQFYKDLLNKKTQSEMATDLERQQEGEQFRVMDQPNLPMSPSFPKRTQFALGGLGGGFFLGLALAFMQEKRQQYLRTEIDVERLLSLPVLTGIPELSHK